MNLNVCTRQVHDGYATIRSRGRNRPRAVYKSDSVEFLHFQPEKNFKCENENFYTSCGIPLSSKPDNHAKNDGQFDGGWVDFLRNNNVPKICATLDCNGSASNSNFQDTTRATLNTFRSRDFRSERRNREICKNELEIRVYNSVPIENSNGCFSTIERKLLRGIDTRNGSQRSKIVIPTVTKKSTTSIKVENDPKVEKTAKICLISKTSKVIGGDSKAKQFVYAIPKKRDRRAILQGNYISNSDLYRTTAKYIEDINKNVAEINENYEQLRSSAKSKYDRSSPYGAISKISKDKTGSTSSSEICDGYLRNRGSMAPMPPILQNFDDSIDECSEKIALLSEEKREIQISSKLSRNKLPPPKPFPRFSSLENSYSYSSDSAATTVSSKSNESIDKSNIGGAAVVYRKSFTKEKDGFESKDEFSLTDDDKSVAARSLDQLPLVRPIVGTLSRKENFVVKSKKPNITNFTRNTLLQTSDAKHENLSHSFVTRKYGTLPHKRPREKLPCKLLHKSSEDVLHGISRETEISHFGCQRFCASNEEVYPNLQISPKTSAYLIDATDLILQGQLRRSSQKEKKEDNYLAISYSRNNLEIPRISPIDEPNEIHFYGQSAFATLPRRGHHSGNDTSRRLSGNLPTLEPLYEHAVSNPVKPRSANNVIPWWELATRKYRHRSCPSLQAHVVSAFEQSLSNMTQRLQQLTATAEKKDSELQELRETIERLRKQSAEAGLNNGGPSNNGRRHTFGDSDSSNTSCTGGGGHQGTSMARQLSADSVTSLNSLSSACSASSHHKKKGWLRSSFSKAFSRSRKNRHGSMSDAEDCKDGIVGDLSVPNSPRLPAASKHESLRGQGSHTATNTTKATTVSRGGGQKSPEIENPLSGSKSSSAIYKKEDEDVDELKKQLREKDLVLTDIRLEALSSAHQLESLKDTVIKMRNEMLNLKQNNERLQRLVTSKSLTSSQSSLPSDPDRRFSMTEVASSVAALSNGDSSSTADQLEDLNVPEHPVVPTTAPNTNEPVLEHDTDGKRINVAIYLGNERNFNYNVTSGASSDIGEPPHCVIANICISNKTTWDTLDSIVRRCLKEYVSRVDPVTNLGLGVDCVAAYYLGEASRCTTDSQHPELLPCGYLIGHVKTIYVVLSGYSWLAVDTLIPRSIVQRLISLLIEHRRVILCGPSGTGKSYLAAKLAHALVDTDNDSKDAAAVATFIVDHKSSKELRQYLAHIAERCDSNAADELPRVIILENLQHATSLGELFSGLLGTRHSSCPAIIGTMSQATCSTTNLQLHHNFRWVLCANHMEPVKGFLGRYLRRKLLEHELRESGGTRNAEMAAVVEWLPRVWQHLNKFLETHSSSDVTIGPRLFLSCPMEVAGSQVWFTDLWNYSVIPYLVEAVREGLTLYSRRSSSGGNTEATWEDPAHFIISSYPWISTHAVHGGSEALLRLKPEDVGYDVVSSGHTSGVGASSVKSLGSTHSDTEGDPLLNMLMRLQEAANYSSPQSNDSDSITSLDSSHTRHSEDLSSTASICRGVESAL